MKGTLGKSIPEANKYTTIYISDLQYESSKISILINNPNPSQANVDILITSLNVLSTTQQIAKSKPISGSSGILRIDNIDVSPGERILVRSDKADTIFRVYGKETVE